MGNRAIIIPRIPRKSEPVVSIYVHWNGGLESVLAFCEVCRQRKFADPTDCESYAMARFCGLIHEFFGIKDSLNLGLYVFTRKEWLEGDFEDNGVYVLGKNWEIVEHKGGYYGNGTTIDDLSEQEKEKYQEIVNLLLNAKWVSE